ncbi:MAG TPA: iron ABC transporter permease [Actinomycetota bacterium]|nr:iron ABC transporter permease [Actinomycetota bacterium]
MASRAEGGRAPAAGLRIACAAIALLFAAPFVYLVVRNAAAPARLWSVVTSRTSVAPLARSVVLAAAVAAAAAAVGTAAAWLVTRTDVPGRRAWRVLLPLPLVIPSFIGAFVMLAAFAPGGLLAEALRPLGVERLPSVRGFAGSFVVLTLFTFPYVYLPAAARLARLAPSLEESARLLGTSPRRVFVTVVLPQARGAIVAGTLLVFLYVVGDFGVVQLMRYDTLTRVVYATRLLDPPTSLGLSLELGVLALLVVALERTASARRAPVAARRGPPALTVPLGRWRPAAATFLAAVVGVGLAVPVGVLAWWAARGVVRGTTVAGSLGATVTELAGPAANTAVASIAAAAAAVALVVPLAYLTVRHRGPLGGAANAVVVAGFALPGLAIALALVFWTLGGPGLLGAAYQTVPLLVFAYVVHFGAQSMRAAQVALAAVPPGLDDAARVLGARPWRRVAAVELPLMAPGLLAGAGLVLLSAMKELPATLLLAPAGFQTLATEVWAATESAFFADASIAALALVALSGVLTWVLVIRRADVMV